MKKNQMSSTTLAVATPKYLLRDGNDPVGPECADLPTGAKCQAVYGFSSKIHYDSFRKNRSLRLTPYPLVRVYLREHVAEAATGLSLIVLDASGIQNSALQAATMQSVLTAHEDQSTHVAVTHRLTFDQQANVYRVNEPPG